MVRWKIVYTRQALKDAKKLSSSGLRPNAERLRGIIAENPFVKPPPYEMLVGEFKGAVSRRINIQHRLVHQVVKPQRTVKALRMWTHYE